MKTKITKPAPKATLAEFLALMAAIGARDPKAYRRVLAKGRTLSRRSVRP